MTDSALFDPEPASDRVDRSARVLDDLLLLTALAANVALVVFARPNHHGEWRIHWYGQTSRPQLPSDLLDRMAAIPGPTEITDLLDVTPDSPIAESMRWAFGVRIRDGDEKLLGLLVLLDPWLRTRSHREDTALQKAARRILAFLTQTPSVSPGRQIDAHIGPDREESLPRPRPANKAAPIAARQTRPEGRGDRQPAFLLRTGDVAARFDVTERTIINWASAGRIPSIRTIGGHLRFHPDDIEALLKFRSGPPVSARQLPNDRRRQVES